MRHDWQHSFSESQSSQEEADDYPRGCVCSNFHQVPTDLPAYAAWLDQTYKRISTEAFISRRAEACAIFRLSANSFYENITISKLPSRNYEYRGSYITAIILRTNGNLSTRSDASVRSFVLNAATARSFASYSLSRLLAWEFSFWPSARSVYCSLPRK